ncbi:MAG: hypothetical protein HOM55_04075 [Proteobacteria bacterium]|jgi:6-pyruvoyl-tetrahydropterin synthase|nr:hypothetical protein [Pseudomonadota bacterium]
MRTLFVDNLTVIDCSLLDSELGLSGASWIVDLTLSGDLNDESMLLDFGVVKKQVKALIDREVDHKLIVPQTSVLCAVQTDNENTVVHFGSNTDEQFSVDAPKSAFCLLPNDSVNIAAIKAYLHARLTDLLPENISTIEIGLRDEQKDNAIWFRYSHGLKKHNGNCQRITHGHRSRLEIHIDGTRDHALEREWVSRLDNIYIATREDLEQSSDRISRFSYAAEHGTFSLSLPEQRVWLVDCDSTIEEIAQTLAEAVAKNIPGKSVKLIAYEGVDKGAIGLVA